MARPLRIEYEGAFYHITARGNERKRIFFAKSDCERFINYLRTAQEKYGYRLHCYVLMTNHYHLLIETPHGNMRKVMHYVNASYTNYINRKRQRSGHLFQGRYKGILVDHDNYLLELSRYLHLNPVRANLVEKPEDYSYSSYRSYVSGKKEDIVYTDLILEMISGDRKESSKRYKEFVENVTGDKLESPLKGICGGAILGGEQFVKQALGRIKETMVKQEDISCRRELQAVWRTGDIIEAVATCFNVSRGELSGVKGLARDITIYLLKRHTGLTNRDIGELFGGLSYSGVSKAYQRFSARLSNDRSLGETIKKITAIMSNVKT